MKKIFVSLVLMAIAFTQTSMAQDAANSKQLPELLNIYYQIKDALINENSNVAATQAKAFLKTVEGISQQIPDETRASLVKAAGIISGGKEIKTQRDAFANLSTTMYDLAKSLKLGTSPVYYDYCPMKKSYWLSNDKAIKNPYYGSSMLTCGRIVETLP